jgi:hypothetical protein
MSASKTSSDASAPFADMNGNAARAIAAATAQINLALREAHEPVDSLGQTLERIAAHMQELRGQFLTHTKHCGDAQGMLEMDLAVEKLAGEMAGAIQSMQFFDRMFQHLTHVHDYLNAGAENLATVAYAPEEATVADAAQQWELLRDRLFSRLLTDAQRQVLDLMMPPQLWQSGVRGKPKPMHAGPGEIELF